MSLFRNARFYRRHKKGIFLIAFISFIILRLHKKRKAENVYTAFFWNFLSECIKPCSISKNTYPNAIIFTPLESAQSKTTGEIIPSRNSMIFGYFLAKTLNGPQKIQRPLNSIFAPFADKNLKKSKFMQPLIFYRK